MSEPEKSDQPSESAKKNVIIFVGSFTAEMKRKMEEAAKKRGADAVEFLDEQVNEYETALGCLSKDPGVKVAVEVAEEVSQLYIGWFHGFKALFEKSISKLGWQGKSMFEQKTVHYLCDRIIHTPSHIVTLNLDDPIYSYVDSASLNRSLFETAVNCLYLRADKTNRSFAALISKSIEEDIKLRDELLKWTSNQDPEIAEGAKLQIQTITTDQKNRQVMLQGIGFNGAPPAFPDIKSRCDQLGDVWKFLYISRYKQLCQWSHIHLEHVGLSPSHTIGSPPDLSDSIRRGTQMVSLSFHLSYLFLMSLSEHDADAQKKIKQLYLELIDALSPVLAK